MSNEIATTQPQVTLKAVDENLPAHLQRAAGDKPVGLQLLNQYRIPPRLKIVQGQSKPELKKEFPEGSVICMPQKTIVAPMGFDEATRRFTGNCKPFHFTPLFFFPEYFCFNPIKLSHLSAIRERSTDPRSALAKKAKRKETREEICPDDKEGKEVMRNREALTFIVHLIDVPELWGVPVSMSFMAGEYGTGQRFISDIGMRHADLFGNVFCATTALRQKDQFSWYGYQITGPAPGTISQWVDDPALYDYYKQEHLSLEQAWKDNLLMTDIDDEDRPQGSNVVDAAPSSKEF